jgi:hypothetical protein
VIEEEEEEEEGGPTAFSPLSWAFACLCGMKEN